MEPDLTAVVSTAPNLIIRIDTATWNAMSVDARAEVLIATGTQGDCRVIIEPMESSMEASSATH